MRQDGTPPPLATALDAAVPLHLRLGVDARLPVARGLAVGVLAQGRHYGASEAFEAHTLFDVAATPEVALGPLAVHAQLGATLGSLRGVRIGGGVSWGL